MKLRKNQKVKFKAICEFTGEILELEGIIINEAYKYIKAHQNHQDEYGEILEDETYIIKEDSNFVKLHLVLLKDILIE